MVVAVVASTVCGMSGAASASPRVLVSKALAKGVTYRALYDGTLPVHMYALEFKPGTRATLDTVLSGAQIGTFARTSTMGTHAGALAAINGDFFTWPARPTHQFVSNGMPVLAGQPGVSFGFRRDEQGGTIGSHPLRIRAENPSTKSSVSILAWNTKSPNSNDVVGFSTYGGSYERPSRNECSARLIQPTAIRWNQQDNGAARDLTVDKVLCSSSSALGVLSGSVVLSSRLTGAGATFIKGLQAGQTVHLSWANDMPGVVDEISGNTMVLRSGAIQYPPGCSSDLCHRNPRTAIGITAAGAVIMLVVDGRSSASVGLTFYELGKEMKALGCVDALNLDGGGSATMWIKGMGVVNHPSDSSGERPVANGLVILPGADTAEPSPLAPV